MANYKYNLNYQVGKVEEQLNKLVSQDKINAALIEGAKVYKAKAKELTPIHFSNLIENYEITDPSGDSIQIVNNTEYAPFIEFGTGIYASDGNGRKTGWAWYDASGDYRTKNNLAADPYDTALGDKGLPGEPGWVWTRGYDPDKDRPRGGHMMERAGQEAEKDIRDAMRKVLMEGK